MSSPPRRNTVADVLAASRPVRVSVAATLVAWAGWVAIEYHLAHPVPWQEWATLLHEVDWSLLAPQGEKLWAAARHACITGIVVLAAGGLGRPVLTRLWGAADHADTVAADTSRGERFWLCVACGLAVFATLLVALAAAGLFYTIVVQLLVFVPAAAGAPGLWRFVRLAPPVTPSTAFRGVRRLARGILAVGLVSTLPLALSPLIRFDALVYHLALPRAYLAAHGFVAFPYNVFANAPHAMALLYALPLSLGGEEAVNLLHGACGVGMLVLTAGLGRRLLNATAGVLAALLTFATPLAIDHWGTAYVDLAMGFAFTATVWAAWQGLSTGHAGAFRVMGLLLGFFAGIKYTALSGVVGLGVGLVAVLAWQRAPARTWARVAAPAALGLLLGAGPWLLKNWAHVGNPIFPMATEWLGRGPWSVHEIARLGAVAHRHGMGRTPVDLLLLPWRISVLGAVGASATFNGVILPIWLMTLPLLLVTRKWPRGLAFFGVVVAAYGAAWAGAVHITRYLLPIFPLLSLLTLFALQRAAPSRLAGSRWAGPLLAAGLLATGVWWTPPLVDSLVRGATIYAGVAWGGESRDAFIGRSEQTAPVYAYMARHVSPDAGVIGLWENRAYRCPRRLEGDAVMWAPQWLDRFAAAEDLDAYATELRGRGLTHVLYNSRFEQAFPPMTGSPEEDQLVARGRANIRAFLARQCEPLFSERGLHLYRIRSVDPAGGGTRYADRSIDAVPDTP